MPRFFFDLYDDLTSIDEEGHDFPSLQAARESAIDQARAIACAEVVKGYLNLKHRIEIRDDSGATGVAVRFGEVIELEQ